MHERVSGSPHAPRTRGAACRGSGAGMNKLDRLIHQRAKARRKTVQASVSRIVRDAGANGIQVSVVGSLASGRFGAHSDVDLLVHGDTDSRRRALIERLVADHLRDTGVPYDLIFASDISATELRELLHGGV